MPLYEYKCPKCGVFEVLQKITDDPLVECLICKGKVEKLISVPAEPVFTGHGFYCTDYCKKSKPKEE